MRCQVHARNTMLELAEALEKASDFSPIPLHQGLPLKATVEWVEFELWNEH